MRALWIGAVLAAAACAAPRPLFDGKTLAGWTAEGPRPSFRAAAGEIEISGTGNEPNWLHTTGEYENFRLHFEYKLARWGEAAVILRAPRMGRPMQSGLAVYLADDYHNNAALYSTGAIPGVAAPAHAPKSSYDVWHSVDLVLDRDHLTAAIDDAVVQDVRLSADERLRLRPLRGFIGFPDLGYRYSLRNLQVEELGAPTPSVDLLAGSLEGWDQRGTGEWRLREGVLSAFGGDGNLYAPGDYQDLELSFLVRTHDRVNSGVFLHGSPDPRLSRGFEVQIYSPVDSVYPTGSIYNVQRAEPAIEHEGRWLFMQIRVEGGVCTVRLDGATVATSNRLPADVPSHGRIGLQLHSPDSLVEFRDLRVRALKGN